MNALQERIAGMNGLLAPFAVPHHGLLGRVHREPEDDTRTPFQRDRDRIIHTQAFRRLQGKTQVFVAGEGDHYRTRLTHTMEVAQIARDMARTLRLNEDLTECIALGHDLGHPPFGHAGEDAIDAWMKQFGSQFEHNAQTLRVVEVLEEHSGLWPGLNLNRDVLEGLKKHRENSDLPRGLSLEAQLVNLADEIAYTGHDCDDALEVGILDGEDLQPTLLGRRALEQIQERNTSIRGALIDFLVTDLYAATEAKLKSRNISSLDDVYAHRQPLVAFSAATQEDLREFRKFLWQHVYFHPAVLAATEEGQKIVRALCEKYHQNPTPKILALQNRHHCSLHDCVKDYVAGMTDMYARMQYMQLGSSVK